MKGFTEILRGINGGYELNRVVGAIGGVVYIIAAQAFVAWNMWKGNPFDVTAYCLAFPAGLATIAGGTAAAVSLKDRNVASAKVVEQTGAVPAKPPAGPKVPQGKAPPVDDPEGEA